MGLMPKFVWDICAVRKDVVDGKELCVTPTVVGGSLSGYDLLVVPGGLGTRPLQYNVRVQRRAAARPLERLVGR